jgi:hypothetical protein
VGDVVNSSVLSETYNKICTSIIFFGIATLTTVDMTTNDVLVLDLTNTGQVRYINGYVEVYNKNNGLWIPVIG